MMNRQVQKSQGYVQVARQAVRADENHPLLWFIQTRQTALNLRHQLFDATI
jgi:hypothetical protein